MDRGALPPIAAAALPAAVRNGSAADKRAYQAALGFERVLLGQLLAAAPSLSQGTHGEAVTEALGDALTDAGGIGLAPQLYRTTRSAAP